jgi:hypothetical protein
MIYPSLHKSWQNNQAAKEKGKLRIEGKDYVAGVLNITPWDGSENLKVSKLWQHFKILWFESYDSSRFERLAVSILFGGAEFELNTMVLSNAIQDHPRTL